VFKRSRFVGAALLIAAVPTLFVLLGPAVADASLPVSLTGSISCVETGSLGFSPPLTTNGTGKPDSITYSGSLSSCTGNTTQQGITITGGTITGSETLTTDSCSDVASGRSMQVMTARIDWTATGGTVKHSGVRTPKGTFQTGSNGNLTLDLPGPEKSSTTSYSLMGDIYTSNLLIDQSVSNLLSSCGGSGISSMTFNGTNGNTMATFVSPEAPSITSASSLSDAVGQPFSVTVSTTGSPVPDLVSSSTALLPSGVTLALNGDGTATLSGTPGPGTAGTYYLVFVASNSNGMTQQDFTLTVTP
jgi:hypothetical protein